MFDNPPLHSTARGGTENRMWRRGNYFLNYFFSSAGGAGVSAFFSPSGAPLSAGAVAAGLSAGLLGGVLGQPRVNMLPLTSTNRIANFFI
jgi:hypothetical protein